MRTIKWILSLTLIGAMVALFSCNDDEEVGALEVVSIMATGTDLETGNETTVDLNAAEAPTGVPVDPTITIVFNKNVDPATASSTTISLMAGDDEVSLDVTTSGTEVIITPSDELERGTEHTLSLSAGLAAQDGGNFFAITRTFRTGGRAEVVPPQAESQVAYWKFDGDATDEMGTYNADAEIAVTYDEDRFGIVGSAATFDGDESIIEVPNASPLLDTDNFSISFWVRTNSEGHVNADGNPAGHFVFGLGAFFGIQYEISGNYESSKFAIAYETADGTQVSEDMWFPSNATDNTTGGWQGWTFAQSIPPEQMVILLKDNWLHVVYTYDAAEKVGSLYFNGELRKSFDFDLWPDGAPKQDVTGMTYRGSEPDVVDDLAFGFIQSREGTMWDDQPWGSYDLPTSNHFKGKLDDFRIWHAALTQEEVEQLYEDEQ